MPMIFPPTLEELVLVRTGLCQDGTTGITGGTECEPSEERIIYGVDIAADRINAGVSQDLGATRAEGGVDWDKLDPVPFCGFPIRRQRDLSAVGRPMRAYGCVH